MEISGKVEKILPLQTGQSQRGEWRKQEFILETQSQYPKKVCITLWGDRIDESNLSEGDMITARIEIESREYNGRWYTDIKAWRIDKQGSGESPSDYVPQESYDPPSAPMPDEEDDLPF